MKKSIILILLAVVSTAVSAQGPAYKSRLAQPGTEGARVEVTEVGNVAAAVSSVPAGNSHQTVGCYRVEIFFDTSADARQLAYETYAKFRELFPEIPTDEKSDINYSSPKYTVRVGYFLTREEAVAMCGRLKVHFEKAYLRKDKAELSKFARTASATE